MQTFPLFSNIRFKREERFLNLVLGWVFLKNPKVNNKKNNLIVLQTVKLIFTFCFCLDQKDKYVEGEVNIHFKSPVRMEEKDYVSEVELRKRQEEQVHRQLRSPIEWSILNLDFVFNRCVSFMKTWRRRRSENYAWIWKIESTMILYCEC